MTDKSGYAGIGTNSSATVSVERGLNDIRLTLFGIAVTIGLGSAALADGWWQRLVVGVSAFAVTVVAFRVPQSRRYLGNFMYKLTGL